MGNRELSQYITPAWAPVALWERYFADVRSDARVVDPGCGHGPFLGAVPKEFRKVIGVEIDPALAEFARENTGREVLVGDFPTIDLPFQPDVVFGNPPFARESAEKFLERAARSLAGRGRCGFVLPTSFLLFSSTLDKWRDVFSIEQDALPRDLFPRIRYPLSFYMFTADGLRRLRGFVLFDESRAVNGALKEVKLALIRGGGRKGVWRAVVEEALRRLGGRATLSQLYAFIAGRRPRLIATWQATVRRVVQEFCMRIDHGVWALPECSRPC